MSLIDTLRPAVPPLVRGARIVHGPASGTRIPTPPPPKPEKPKRMGRPPRNGIPANAPDETDRDALRLLDYLRSVGGANKPAIVRGTGLDYPRVRYLLRIMSRIGLVKCMPSGLWATLERA